MRSAPNYVHSTLNLYFVFVVQISARQPEVYLLQRSGPAPQPGQDHPGRLARRHQRALQVPPADGH